MSAMTLKACFLIPCEAGEFGGKGCRMEEPMGISALVIWLLRRVSWGKRRVVSAVDSLGKWREGKAKQELWVVNVTVY